MAESVLSLGSNLDGARAKLRRAQQHARALGYSVKRFGDRDPYRLFAKSHPDQVYEPVVSNFGVGVSVAPFAHQHDLILGLHQTVSDDVLARAILTWGVILGDVVQNLSSALDHLVWELSRPQMDAWNPKNDAFSNKQRGVGFPVVRADTNSEWNDACRKQLAFVPAPLHAILKEFQPFVAWQDRGIVPDLHPLAILRETWHRDKHRTVTVNTFAGNLRDAAVYFGAPSEPQPPAEVVELFPIRPLERETELGVIRAHFPIAIPAPAANDMAMNVDGHFTLDVLFGEGAATGKPVGAWMAEAIYYVNRALTVFA